MARESWPAVMIGSCSSTGDVTGAWLGLSERGVCGWSAVGRTGLSVLATYPKTAQVITMGSQMRSGTLRLNSEATRLI
jgi:hypothetical protein